MASDESDWVPIVIRIFSFNCDFEHCNDTITSVSATDLILHQIPLLAVQRDQQIDSVLIVTAR